MFKRSCVVFVCLFLLSPAGLLAGEAKVYTVKLANAAEIQSDSDHFNIIFVSGWVSQNDSFFRSLLSKKSKTAAAIGATGTYFDGDVLKNAWIVENSDVGKMLDRPWGVTNKILLSDIPADTLIPDITVNFGIQEDDRIKQILGVLQGAEPALGTSVQPYLTYATLVDGVLNKVLGTDKTKYPFLMDTGLSDLNVKSPNGMYEHYLIGISPNKDGDQWVNSLDASKLAYSSEQKSLTYEGQPVTDHTYAVFLIQRADRPNVVSLIYTSNAPWAVLALGTFYQSPLPKVTKKEDIPGVEGQYVKNLSDSAGFLKRELRFSALDRAKALYAFAGRAQQMITASCKAANVPDSNCKTPQLQNYEDGIAKIFPLKSIESQMEAQVQSKSLNQQIMTFLEEKVPIT